jgi:hypothetical protein
MLVYDSLYAWCREAQGETHGWYPEKLRAREPRDRRATAPSRRLCRRARSLAYWFRLGC